MLHSYLPGADTKCPVSMIPCYSHTFSFKPLYFDKDINIEQGKWYIFFHNFFIFSGVSLLVGLDDEGRNIYILLIILLRLNHVLYWDFCLISCMRKKTSIKWEHYFWAHWSHNRFNSTNTLIKLWLAPRILFSCEASWYIII